MQVPTSRVRCDWRDVLIGVSCAVLGVGLTFGVGRALTALVPAPDGDANFVGAWAVLLIPPLTTAASGYLGARRRGPGALWHGSYSLLATVVLLTGVWLIWILRATGDPAVEPSVLWPGVVVATVQSVVPLIASGIVGMLLATRRGAR
jgi:hypothetical protein